MAKSRETFSKKEKEKKKLKKKLEKQERREERKSNNNQGVGLDEMMAYVDENGNITSTPPDPTKKKEVKKESILIGVPKQEDLGPEDLIRKGTVSFFNESKGYGFIKDHETQESIFVHLNGLVDSIQERDKVNFEVEMTPKGPNAIGVKLIK
ncbi:cold shock domain-containing protein [Cytophagaceae bacterium ABcell3]|nr:cold shock domain-containing protein [Cytophagaceae bacterium ABcell3]